MTDRSTLTDIDLCGETSERVGSAHELAGGPTTAVLRIHKFGGTSVDEEVEAPELVRKLHLSLIELRRTQESAP